MKTTLLLLTTATVITACGILRGGKPKNAVKVTGTISIEQPVCGEQPGPGEKGPVGETTYYIKNGLTNHPDSAAFEQLDTDVNGKFSVFLAPGDYAIVHKDKLMNFGEFRLKHSQTTNYFKLRDEDCFKRWYTSADFVLHVANDTTVAWLVKSRCYTKTNPCLEYTGPK